MVIDGSSISPQKLAELQNLAHKLAQETGESHHVLTSPFLNAPAVFSLKELTRFFDGLPAPQIHYVADADNAPEEAPALQTSKPDKSQSSLRPGSDHRSGSRADR